MIGAGVTCARTTNAEFGITAAILVDSEVAEVGQAAQRDEPIRRGVAPQSRPLQVGRNPKSRRLMQPKHRESLPELPAVIPTDADLAHANVAWLGRHVLTEQVSGLLVFVDTDRLFLLSIVHALDLLARHGERDPLGIEVRVR